jgi:hypothetical protein
MSELSETLSNITDQSSLIGACPVVRVFSSLDDEDRNALSAVLQSNASTRSIHQALRGANHSIDRASITLHRKKRCQCFFEEGKSE